MAPIQGANLLSVLEHMIPHVVHEFPALPDYRTLSAQEIRFFYRNLESELKERARLAAESAKNK